MEEITKKRIKKLFEEYNEPILYDAIIKWRILEIQSDIEIYVEEWLNYSRKQTTRELLMLIKECLTIMEKDPVTLILSHLKRKKVDMYCMNPKTRKEYNERLYKEFTIILYTLKVLLERNRKYRKVLANGEIIIIKEEM